MVFFLQRRVSGRTQRILGSSGKQSVSESKEGDLLIIDRIMCGNHRYLWPNKTVSASSDAKQNLQKAAAMAIVFRLCQSQQAAQCEAGVEGHTSLNQNFQCLNLMPDYIRYM